MPSQCAGSYMLPWVPHGFTDAFGWNGALWQDDQKAAHAMDVTYYLWQDLNHWCLSSFTYQLVSPQALLGCDYTTQGLSHPLGLRVPPSPPNKIYKAGVQKNLGSSVPERSCQQLVQMLLSVLVCKGWERQYPPNVNLCSTHSSGENQQRR